MDLGHNQQHHPTVHSGGVSRVPWRSPAPPLPLTFYSPSAHLPLPFRFLWTLFVDTFMDNFCGHFVWTLFVDTFCAHFLCTLFVDTFLDFFVDTLCGHLLWTLFVDTYFGHIFWTLVVDTFCGHFVDTF